MMKRNNVTVGIMFALNALCTAAFIVYFTFLHDYTLFFDGMHILASILCGVRICLCAALLFNKDKGLGRISGFLLCAAAVLIPLNRFFLLLCAEAIEGRIMTFDSLIYITLLIITAVTVILYLKPMLLTVTVLVLCVIALALNGFWGLVIAAFGYEDIRELTELPSPDGSYSAVVRLYHDPDSNSAEMDVHTYNSAESISAGPLTLRKDWVYIDDFSELKEELPLGDDNISWLSNSEIRVRDNTYTVDGEMVTEPPEPPL